MSDNNNKSSKTNKKPSQNLLEALRGDAGSIMSGTAKDVKDNAKALPKDFMEQLFGSMPKKKASGEIGVGESFEMNDLMNGQHEENQKLKKQIAFEKKLRNEEESYKNRVLVQHKKELQSILEQTEELVAETKDLKEEIKREAIRGVLEEDTRSLNVIMMSILKAKDLIFGLRKEIQEVKEASIWFAEHKNRQGKKKKGAFWGNYHSKKQGGGASTLLSGESYVSRSAG